MRLDAYIVLVLMAAVGALLGACGGDPLRDDRWADVQQRSRSIDREEFPEAPEPPPQPDEIDVEDLVEPEPAEEVFTLSIEQLRADLLANHLDLQVELYEPEIAEQDVRREEAAFEWSLFADSSVEEADLPGLPDQLGTDHEIGVRIPLKTGGLAQVSVPVSTTRLDAPGAEDRVEAAGRFSITQPLLRDAGVVPTSAIRASTYRRGQVEAQTKLTAIRLIAEAERAYWDLWLARRAVDIRHEQYQRALEQISQAERLVDAGVAPAVEIVRAEAGAARQVGAILREELTRRRIDRQVKRIINRPDVPFSSGIVIVPETDPEAAPLNLDEQALVERALSDRMEILETELQLTIDALRQDVARQQTLPIFAVDFAYTTLGESDRFGGALDRARRARHGLLEAGFRTEIPLGNEFAEAELRQAVLLRLQTLTGLKQRRLLIRQEVHDALDRLRLTWEQILAARRETIQMGQIYDVEREQFREGLRTSTDVNEAAEFLADAQLREAEALADYEIAKVELAFAIGTVLGHGRVELERGATSAPPSTRGGR